MGLLTGRICGSLRSLCCSLFTLLVCFGLCFQLCLSFSLLPGFGFSLLAGLLLGFLQGFQLCPKLGLALCLGLGFSFSLGNSLSLSFRQLSSLGFRLVVLSHFNSLLSSLLGFLGLGGYNLHGGLGLLSRYGQRRIVAVAQVAQLGLIYGAVLRKLAILCQRLIDGVCQLFLPLLRGHVSLFRIVGNEAYLSQHARHISVLADIQFALFHSTADLAPMGQILLLQQQGQQLALARLRSRERHVGSIERLCATHIFVRC